MQPDVWGLRWQRPLAGIHQKAPDASERALGSGGTQTGLSIGGVVCVITQGVEEAIGSGQAVIVLSTVPKVLGPALRRAVATTVRTAASPWADHMAR